MIGTETAIIAARQKGEFTVLEIATKGVTLRGRKLRTQSPEMNRDKRKLENLIIISKPKTRFKFLFNDYFKPPISYPYLHLDQIA